MLSVDADHDEILMPYIDSQKAHYKPAPNEILWEGCTRCGLLLHLQSAFVSKEGSDAVISEEVVLNTDVTDKPSTAQTNDDDDSDNSDREEETISKMQQTLSELETEKKSLASTNAELHRKALALIAREQSMQTQNTGPSRGATGSAPENVTQADLATMAADPSGVSIEREKQYQDTLQLIVTERAKLKKQLNDFDQLAHDLQTRLDDKEFKANTIATSFKQFKK